MENYKEKQSLSLLSNITSVTALVDLNEVGWENYQHLLSSLAGTPIKTEPVFLDMKRVRRKNPWNTPSDRTFFKNDFSIWGGCKSKALIGNLEKKTDIFICLSTDTDKKIAHLVSRNSSSIKIGIVDLPSSPYDVIIGAPEGTKLAEDKVMDAISAYLKTVTWK